MADAFGFGSGLAEYSQLLRSMDAVEGNKFSANYTMMDSFFNGHDFLSMTDTDYTKFQEDLQRILKEFYPHKKNDIIEMIFTQKAQTAFASVKSYKEFEKELLTVFTPGSKVMGFLQQLSSGEDYNGEISYNLLQELNGMVGKYTHFQKAGFIAQNSPANNNMGKISEFIGGLNIAMISGGKYDQNDLQLIVSGKFDDKWEIELNADIKYKEEEVLNSLTGARSQMALHKGILSKWIATSGDLHGAKAAQTDSNRKTVVDSINAFVELFYDDATGGKTMEINDGAPMSKQIESLAVLAYRHPELKKEIDYYMTNFFAVGGLNLQVPTWSNDVLSHYNNIYNEQVPPTGAFTVKGSGPSLTISNSLVARKQMNNNFKYFISGGLQSGQGVNKSLESLYTVLDPLSINYMKGNRKDIYGTGETDFGPPNLMAGWMAEFAETGGPTGAGGETTPVMYIPKGTNVEAPLADAEWWDWSGLFTNAGQNTNIWNMDEVIENYGSGTGDILNSFKTFIRQKMNEQYKLQYPGQDLPGVDPLNILHQQHVIKSSV